jgi:hypothetical protein
LLGFIKDAAKVGLATPDPKDMQVGPKTWIEIHPLGLGLFIFEFIPIVHYMHGVVAGGCAV